jgi:hypothetical protein
MSLKALLWGLIGGAVAGAVVYGVVSMVLVNNNMKNSIFQPMFVDLKTNATAPASLRVSATMYTKVGSQKAKLIVHPFKAQASGTFDIVQGSIVFPVMATPLKAVVAQISNGMFDADGTSSMTGAATLNLDGTLVIKSERPSVDKGAWGLKKTLVLEYEVASL